MNKRWLKILLFVAAPIVVGGLFYWFTWAGTTKPIESVADQFKPDSSWKLVKSEAKAPGLCIAETCPRLQRTWEMSEPLSQEQLVDAVKESGWTNVAIEKGCEFEVCRMQGTIMGYEITVAASSKNSLDNPTINLYMK